MASRKKTQPRKIPRQSRAKETVAVIVEAAARILVADGFEAMNVNRVAELAGVSIGSLYQYFPSKEAVVGAVATKLGDDTATFVAKRLQELAGQPPRDAIRGAIGCVLDAYRLNPALRAVIRDRVRVPLRRVLFRSVGHKSPPAVPHFATPTLR